MKILKKKKRSFSTGFVLRSSYYYFFFQILDQQNLLSNQNKQVIAIIQDNKLILKTIDISPTLMQQSTTTNTSQTTVPKLIQIQPTNTQNSQIILNSNNNNIIQISPSSTPNTIQLLPKNDQQTTFNLDNNQFNNNNNNMNLQQQIQNQNSNFNQMHKLAAVAAAEAAASSSTPSATSPTLTSTSIATTNSIMNTTTNVTSTSNNTNNSSYTTLELTQISHMNDLILSAHKDTWPYLKDKCKKFKTQYNIKRNPVVEQLFNRGLLQLLKDTKFLDYFNSLIENTVLFAKIVPYFMEMHETDRITLLKSSVFEIICIRHSQLFDLINNKFILPLYETHLNKEFLIQKLPECKTFIELLFDFINEFSLIDLNDSEIAVFCSFLLFNTG
jgi:hypothetical protein